MQGRYEHSNTIPLPQEMGLDFVKEKVVENLVTRLYIATPLVCATFQACECLIAFSIPCGRNQPLINDKPISRLYLFVC
jgi:hypothetical protein